MNILITGITRGMGFAIGQMLAPSCDHLLGISKAEPTNSASLDELLGTSKKFSYMACDLSEGKVAAEKVGKWAKSLVPKLDCLVLNAGFYMEGSLAQSSEAEFRQNLEVNFLVNHFLVQELLGLIENSTRKRIIVIGSTAAYEAYPIVPTYGVAKWALRGYAVNLRKELAPKRIGVSFISPGATWTDMWKDEPLPRERLMEASDIARVVLCILQLSEQAVVEEVIVRPMDGDFHE